MAKAKLARGDAGDAVRALHGQLSERGHEIPRDERVEAVFGDGTERSVRAWQESEGVEPTGVVTADAASRLGIELGDDEDGNGNGSGDVPAEFQFLVRGQVIYSRGLPVPGVTVRAFNKELRSEDPLGETVTDDDGKYEIYYSARDFSRPGKFQADLVVRAYADGDGDGDDDDDDDGVRDRRKKPKSPKSPKKKRPAKGDSQDAADRRAARPGEKVVAESAVLFGASRVTKLRLLVEAGPGKTWSEYEQLVSELRPLLGDVAIEDLHEDGELNDVTLLSGQVRQPLERVAALVVAHKLAAETGLAPEFHYALVRGGQPTNLSNLLAEPPDVHRLVLKKATADRVIPARLADRIDEAQEGLRAAAASQAGTSGSAVASALDTVLDASTRSMVIERYANHQGSITEFWSELAAEAVLGDRVGEVQLSLQFAAVTGGNASLTKVLVDQHARGALPSFRHLASLDEAAWIDTLEGADVPDDELFPDFIPDAPREDRVRLYASTMHRVVSDALPTAVVAYRMAADESQPTEVRNFWSNVAAGEVGFELGHGPVAPHLAQNDALLAGIDDVDAVVRDVEVTQRLFNVSTRYDDIAAMRSAGIDSALAISRMGEGQFLAKVTGTVEAGRAQLLYENARTVSATALNLLSLYSPVFNNVVLHALQQPPTELPNLEALFGSLDLCACDHCRSVHSPAAYLAELLSFLKERAATTGSVRDALLARRPDLAHVELTCENTNTPLPYVDLVNEILEDVVAPFQAINLPANADTALDNRTLSSAAADAMTAAGEPLTPQHVVVVGKPGEKWSITDHSVLYAVEKVSGRPKVVARTNQTSHDALALDAAPEHTNDAAYEVLRGAVFPFSLPLDTWWEDTRAYLGHLGIERHELMTALAPDPFAAAREPAIAGEVLGMPPFERDLVIGGTPVRLASTGPVALAGLSPVDGVAPVAGDRVLVRAQANAADNGVYRASAQAWSRDETFGTTAMVRVREGSTLAGNRYVVAMRAGARLVEKLETFHLWGLKASENALEVFDATQDDERSVQSLGWVEALRHVRVFLGRSTLTYDDLLKLLQTSYGNPSDDVVITSFDADDLATCDVLKLGMPALDGDTALRAHRFVRLWRRLGWTMAEVDRAITAFGDPTSSSADRLDEQVLVRAAHAALVVERLSIGPDEAIALWAPLGTTAPVDEKSPYERIYLDLPGEASGDPALAVEDGEIALLATDAASATIHAHAPAVLAALGIAAADLRALTERVTPDGVLSIANLSALYRHVTLARATGLTVTESLDLQRMAGIDPFDLAHPEDTIVFVGLVERLRSSGFNVADLGYVLFHENAPVSPLAPSDGALDQTLDDLRRTLRGIAESTTPKDDPEGEQTRRLLAALRWPADLVNTFVAELAGQTVHAAALPALPADLALPPEIASRVGHDAATSELRVRGALTSAERAALTAESADAAFHGAVQAVFDQPRAWAERHARAYAWPRVSAPLADFPVGELRGDLRARIWFDDAADRVWFDGYMTPAEHASLDTLSADAAWRAAVQQLADASATAALAPEETLATAARVAEIFDRPAAAERFGVVNRLLLERERSDSSRRAVVRQLSEAVNVDTRTVERLLTAELKSAFDPTRAAIADFLDEGFAASNPNVPVTTPSFAAPRATLVRLYKVAVVVRRLRPGAGQLEWMARLAPTVPDRPVPWVRGAPLSVGWLRLGDLPFSDTGAVPARFAEWLRLVELCRLRDETRGGDITLSDVMTLARDAFVPAADLPGALLDRLAARTGADADTLAAAARALALALPDAFLDETGVRRVHDLARAVRRIGSDVATLVGWTAPRPGAASARTARQTANARHTATEWASVAPSIEDGLREKRRSALVAYLAARGPVGTDESDLYRRYLIDVEMDPCMTTSRIKQAISSVQLFVQRCLLNLEPSVTASQAVDSGWAAWRWMKTYRVWEAQVKTFLYPENWLVPELRDDKTPFFRELESALLQGDVTAEAVEDAFTGYLEKLDAVARLEVAGMFHEAASGGMPDVLHVFARTAGTPSTYYYRQWVDRARWTAWERVDLDIAERQILPIVWNRRLFLFWPIFTESADQQVPSSGQPENPKRHFDYQLAWSERKRGKWTAKKTTPAEMTVRSVVDLDVNKPDHGRSEHVMRSSLHAEGGLHVWLERDREGTDGTPAYGPVLSAPNNAWEKINGFFFTGCNGRIQTFVGDSVGVFQPTGTIVSGMTFVEHGLSPLHLPKEPRGPEGIALEFTPGEFSLLYAHQDMWLTGDRPFFYQDEVKTYFVLPIKAPHIEYTWKYPDRIDPTVIDLLKRKYYEVDLIPDPLAPIERVYDPPPIDRFLRTKQVLADREILAGVAGGTVVGSRTKSSALVAARTIALVGGDAVPGAMTTRAMATRASHALVARGVADLVEAGTDGEAPAGLVEFAATEPLHLLALAGGGETARVRQAMAERKAVMLENLGRRPAKLLKSTGDLKYFGIAEYISRERLVRPEVIPVYKFVHRYRFLGFWHPYVCSFMQELGRVGIDGLLRREIQMQRTSVFKARYKPTPLVARGNAATDSDYPAEDVDFSYEGAYSQYNWELFFHVPLMLAAQLSRNQRFEEAQRWFHYIFDPTTVDDDEAPRRYWRTRPFYEQNEYLQQRIDNLLEKLAKGISDDSLTRQVREWAVNPFKPFVIARLRTVAFQKMVVMRYLDNLIAWGDQLFRRDTIESINEATQLYILAAELLGPRPTSIAPRSEPVVHTYNTLDPRFDAMANKLVEIEHLVTTPKPDSVVMSPVDPPLPLPRLLYFCVPQNENLLDYWDKVADRLFKIRHCMNIEGSVRQLPLFEPPIDPALLVKAAAAGLEIGTVLAETGAAMPRFRFRVLAQKAAELATHLQSLGASLLSAVEKRDAEQLALVRVQHERTVLDLSQDVREEQVREAKQGLTVLRKARDVSVARYTHYMRLLGVTNPTVPGEGQTIPDPQPSGNARIQEEEGVKLLAHERNELAKLKASAEAQSAAGDWDFAASIANVLPTLSFGVAWGVLATISWGGPNIGAGLGAIANRWRADSGDSSYAATRSGRLGQHVLREHDWVLQARTAAREIMHIDQQLLAASIREAVANAEVEAQRKQIGQATEMADLLETKYTNQELYDWMVTQISAVYFQAYQLAYDVAKRAERAFRYELAAKDTNYVQFGYWDSVRKGLLAGERLLHDIRRMEVAYLEQDQREHELVKHVSVWQLHPEGLLELRETGSCFFELPEPLFDLDHPGHYMRRIKSVSLTIPATTGPYTSINCKLTLLANRVRHDSRATGAYRWTPGDRRFTDGVAGIQSIVTSSAREDAGLFEVNLHDERFLPFEGAGAISTWRLELPDEFRQFDYRTISDVILHVRYTARDGGEPLRRVAIADMLDSLAAMEVAPGKTGLARALSARHEFSDAWRRFVTTPPEQAGPQTLELVVTPAHFPAIARDREPKIDKLVVFALVDPDAGYDENDPIVITLTPPAGDAIELELAASEAVLGGLPAKEALLPGAGVAVGDGTTWRLAVTGSPVALSDDFEVGDDIVRRLKMGALRDVGVLVHYVF